MPRTDWTDLPAAVRAAVEAHTGPVTAVAPVADGLTCHTAAVLTSAGGRVFVKGVPLDDEAGVRAQAVEAVANQASPPASPRFRARVQAAGWDLLLFDAIDARHADLTAGSPDVPLVADVLQQTHGLPAPAALPRLADRYRHVLCTDEMALLDGQALLHTDTNPHNLLIGGGRAWLADWAMAAAGPPWVDVAYTAVRLMESDWTPQDALAWARQFPAWRGADPAAVAALVNAACRDWTARIGDTAAQPSNHRFETLLNAHTVTP